LADEPRFRKIDEQNRGDHTNLSAADECYFLYEYTSGRNYSFGSTNSLISNLKKKPSQAALPGYHYKRQAIDRCTREFRSLINPTWLKFATLVPVPPSKARGHPDYDDRMLKICQAIQPTPPLDVRELVVQQQSLEAAHETTGQRPSVADLLAVYAIDEGKAAPAPQAIGIFDDVLTVGTHFVATKTILARRFPTVSIVGIFIARRVFANPSAEFQGTLI
jgi:hypothetical protein